MQDLRIILIIVGAIAIGALLVHGYLTNRRNNPKPIKDRPFTKVGNDSAPSERETDEDGFDADGIGKVNVLKSNGSKEKVEPGWGEVMPDPDDEPALTDIPEVESDAGRRVSNPKAERVRQPSSRRASRVGAAAAPANQQPAEAKEADEQPQDVFVLNVVGGEQPLQGASLLPVLLTLGFKFGEMNIFHRHQDSAGNGKVLFSLANMVKPGVFDLDTMEQFETPGVSLFMTVPCAGDAMANFELMLQAAQKLADELDGQLLDGHRNPLTQQMVQHYAERIREFERKRLLAG